MYGVVADRTIDLGSLRCPHLLLAAIRETRQMSDGQVLQIYAKDLNAPSSLVSWIRQSKNELLELYHDHDTFVFFLRYRSESNTLSLLAEYDRKETAFLSRERIGGFRF